ncbi:MAG: thymidine phosphorylase [Clostridiales bacterium]|jgi:pyrimidine-nucleoside phosphorylase|nr:thymidine phosphorylase [Clostridiales bacterium]
MVEKIINILEIVAKKRDGYELNEKEIFFFIDCVIKNKIKDYQTSAMLMAIFINGMSEKEVFDFTRAMINSGKVLDLSDIPGIKIDKHSTGGIGDTVTLIVAPWVASCGLPVIKMSGRGLGYTGGTIDKLNSINIKTNLSDKQAIGLAKKTGLAIIEQTDEIAVADKKIYELRDVTSTVESLPLIASSIMSKKIATGADGFVLDVKFGNGALIQDLNSALKLANIMILIGKKFKKKIVAIISDMNEPLGSHVGNLLEIQEAIMILKNQVNKNSLRLLKLSYEIASNMLILSGIINDKKSAYELLKNKLENFDAYKKFLDFTKNQSDEIFDYNKIIKKQAKYKLKIYSDKEGFVNKINARTIGQAAFELGAGRTKKSEIIDYEAGIIIKTKINDFIKKREILFEIFCNDNKKIDRAVDILKDAIVLSDKKIKKNKIIYKVIHG